ncbi:hypothetical protein RR45_GL001004 [Lactococcus chungangensis CAU 28 = DSM 22330]|uniref:Uncharacterized protein n=1 Tax=Pseudolactococcus chungangensis CAU 28 = DSM 22330 TaxID=1122154 RepID=A0ABX4I5C7_9LACT|nr:hypothetical protein RR45_GL001004 [Lactococcus chungangensis CAU 28 = DSM 22330]
MISTLIKKYFITKREAFDKIFSNWWPKYLNCVSVNRKEDATSAMKLLKNKL